MWDLPLFPFGVQDLGESVLITISYWTVMTDLERHHPGCRCSGSNERGGSSKAFPPTIPDAVMPAHCVTGSLWNTHARVYSPTETDIFHCSWKFKKKEKRKRDFGNWKKATCSDILGKRAQWWVLYIVFYKIANLIIQIFSLNCNENCCTIRSSSWLLSDCIQ